MTNDPSDSEQHWTRHLAYEHGRPRCGYDESHPFGDPASSHAERAHPHRPHGAGASPGPPPGAPEALPSASRDWRDEWNAGDPNDRDRPGRATAPARRDVAAFRAGVRGPFVGRGPKDYRRADETILDEVCQCLERHGDVDASEVEVGCTEGVVTLRGAVDSRWRKREAEECLDEIYGVVDVLNELRVERDLFSDRPGPADRPQAPRGSDARSGDGGQHRPGAHG